MHKILRRVIWSVTITIFLGWHLFGNAQEPTSEMTPIQRQQTEVMLADMRDAVKQHYYDSKNHGIDLDARYRTYKDKLSNTGTLGEAFRTVAAYLSGLNDSHTFFIPPRRSYQAEYGYRMQIIGDKCYITETQPETDAAAKLHPGDQVLSLDGFSLNRDDLWQLEYYLDVLAPKPSSAFIVRGPSGEVRKEQVLTKYAERKHIKDLTTQGGLIDNYKLDFEDEKIRHSLDSRYVDQGDVMIWKMPVFALSDSHIDHLVDIARKHRALILDLRDDPGGYVETLDHMVGSFFDHDVNICTRVTRKDQKLQVARSRGKRAFAGDLVVLVDSRSASAAEVFARVIQLQHRGAVLGDHTSGSVMEAVHFPFSTGIDIKIFYGASITTADVIMADGKSLEKVGVTPDVIVLPSGEQLAQRQDPVLSRAAASVGLKLDPPSAGKLFPYEWVPLSNAY